MARVVLAGGGTGGHIMPGLALAEEFEKKGCELLWVGAEGGLEQVIVPRHGIRYRSSSMRRVSGGVFRQVRRALSALGAVSAEKRALAEFEPDVVLGLGGYAAVPVLYAAKKMSLPYFLLEQNTVPGKVTRHFAPSARAVFSQFTEARQRLAKNVIFQHTGSPVRKSIIDTIHNAKDNRLSKSETILVLGGSQGSRKINRTVCASLPELELELPGLKMLHLAGKLDFEEVQQAYEGRSAHEVYDFVDEIEELYVRCTAVIARAGAVSLAELSLLGVPAFLVPFPYAADDHQTKNARVYEKQNAAEVLRQGELSPQTLTKTLSATLRDTAQRKRMCDQILKFARPNAAQLICDTVLDEI